LFLDQRFLYQAILSEKIQRLIKESISGQAITRITLEKISKFSMSMPSLPEQQKIADCLASLDALITAQAEKIDALKTHKKGLMQQLFPAMDEVST
jgi:type I restriction enzyme S subunit